MLNHFLLINVNIEENYNIHSKKNLAKVTLYTAEWICILGLMHKYRHTHTHISDTLHSDH